MRKILVSPGFGAGWTTWADEKFQAFALEYKPIIEFIENGGTFEYKWGTRNSEQHPVLTQFLADLTEAFPDEPRGDSGFIYFYLGGACDLEVQYVEGEVRIEEYDGSETVIQRSSDYGWL